MDKLIDRLKELATRKDRFTYDLRGNCQVYSGVIACYRASADSEHFTEMPAAIMHALENDSVLTVRRDADGKLLFDSCRVFTDLPQALRFAAREKQRSVYNLNRGEHVQVDTAPLA